MKLWVTLTTSNINDTGWEVSNGLWTGVCVISNAMV